LILYCEQINVTFKLLGFKNMKSFLSFKKQMIKINMVSKSLRTERLNIYEP
jgi:hypothetical protein